MVDCQTEAYKVREKVHGLADRVSQLHGRELAETLYRVCDEIDEWAREYAEWKRRQGVR